MKRKHNNVAAVILAAGEGTRMKSRIPKVLHFLCGRPMLGYVLDLVKYLRINKVIAVLGHKHENVKKLLEPGTKFVIQKRLLGTADAVKEALALLKSFKGSVLILYGDNPLLKAQTLEKLLKYHFDNNLDATLLTANVDNPSGYGRVLRDKYANICGITEEKDADDFQKGIKEVNTGIICFKKERLFECLKHIRANNASKEYYLTDIVGIFYKKGYLIDNFAISDIQEALGVNSRLDLAQANTIMQQRINEELLEEGVTIVDPHSAFINYGTKIGRDTKIYPFTVIERNVKIGKNCSVGPFVHLKSGTVLEDEVVVGNFLEVVRSKFSAKTKVKHFGYIGDTRLGRRVNVGAGCVTANFDGVKKNKTVIEDNVFLGSDTVLVAPVKIGKGARTGAGAVVLKNRNVRAGLTVAGVPARPLKLRERGK